MSDAPHPPLAGILLSWVDGDTPHVEISLALYGIILRRPVRVYGINCPEIHSRDPAEVARGLAALAFARDLIHEGTPVVVTPMGSGQDKYGRVLAKIGLLDGRDYGDEAVKAGHAVPYFGVEV